MKRLNVIISIMTASVLMIACASESGNKESSETEEGIKNHEDSQNSTVLSKSTGKLIYESKGLKVHQANITKEFPNASLKLQQPKMEEVIEAGEYEFGFEVDEYELAEQTPNAAKRHCANSQKGQHIHFILNNSPYEAHYQASFNAKLMEGNNVVLAFLSRSYHESIKNGKAYVLKNFQIGETFGGFDANAEHLFYSRPKGTYSGEDIEKILLDFYLVNTKLSAEGNQVKVMIDEHEFKLSSWEPYFVEGLTKGSHSFRIQLIDKDGNQVQGPFNDSGSRVIEIK